MSSHRSFRLVLSPSAALSLLAVAALGWLAAPPVFAQEGAQEARTSERTAVPVQDETDTVTVEMKRIALPGLSGEEDQPYSALVPINWLPRRDLPAPGVFVGPSAGSPESHPEMLLVRETDVDVSDPDAILHNLRANAEQNDWELIEGEVRDFGGARGLWIVRRLPPHGLHGERVNMAVKVPLEGGRSLDVLATLPADQWTGVVGQQVEQMLGSVAPSASEPTDRPQGD
jgi:hypothetical protein